MRKVTLKSLENKLDRLVSEYVRRSAADEGGTASCVTCGRLDFWREMDCGHYIKRQHKATRWILQNLGIQCRKCNRFAGGMMDEFAIHIQRKYGMGTLEELHRLKHTAYKPTRSDLEEQIEKYKGLIDHNCPVEGRMMIEEGKECNWCSELDDAKADDLTNAHKA